MPCFYRNPEQDNFNKIPEMQVCLAEALYDIESIISDPGALPKGEVRTLRDQIVSNLERAWELTGGSEDQLTGTMLQISEVKTAESGATSHQLFCPECASPIYSTAIGDGPKILNLRVGTARQRAELRPKVQYWCHSAQGWVADLGQAKQIDTQ